jgi:hypothetical protein
MIELTPPPTDAVRLKFHPWQPADGHLGLHPDLPGNGTTSRDDRAGRTSYPSEPTVTLRWMLAPEVFRPAEGA